MPRPPASGPALFAALFNPRAVALVGASGDPAKNTGRPQRFLARHGYRGKVFPVNPARDEIGGVRAYPDLDAVPEPVDHALVMVPASAVPGVIEACGRARVPVATVYSDGYAESGAEGRARQDELLALAGACGVRLVGPNSMGLLDVRSGAALTVNAVLELPELRAGATAVVSQSGTVIGSLLSRGQARGVGFSKLVSVGNECDVGVGEIVDGLAEDADTGCILLFLEVVRDCERLARAARHAFAAGKPVVAYKLGRSESGRRLAATHSGAILGASGAAGAFFRHYGIVRVEHLETLIEIPRLLAGRAPPEGKRVAVLSTTGGGAATVADRLGASGCDLVPPPAALVGRMRAHGIALERRPIVDVTMAGARPEVYAEALEVLVRSAECDAVVAVVGSSALTHPQIAVRPILEAVGRGEKPLAVFLLPDAPRSLALLDEAGIAAFRTPEGCADAVRAFLEWRPPAAAPAADPQTTAAVRAALGEERGTLDEARSLALFAALGVPVAAHAVVRGPGERAHVPFPVAVKVLSRDVTHKSEAGGVVLDVLDDAALDAACAHVTARFAEHAPDARVDGVLVQRMERGLAEAIVGYRRDPEAGPLVTVGAGGVLAEVWRDVVLRIAPVDEETARAMIDEVRGLAPVRGYRGLPRGDVAALARATVAVSRLALLDSPRVLEAEINPLVVKAEGEGVCAVDAVVVVADGEARRRAVAAVRGLGGVKREA